MKKILLVHDLMVPLENLFKYVPDWQVQVTSFPWLPVELKTSTYDGLIIDLICPEAFKGEGLFDDIWRHESLDGEVMAFVLALRLREAYPDLPIAITGDAGIPGDLQGRRLLIRCTQHDICYSSLSDLKSIVDHINLRVQRRAKAGI